MDNMNQEKSPLNNFSPKQIFLFGIVEGILVLCTIGFFILLGLVLNGTNVALGANTDGAAVPVDTGTGGGAGQPVKVTVRPVDEKNDHIRGDKDADVTIIEYSDLECPFCKLFHPTMQQIVNEYKGKVRWVYRHFPLDSLHSQARKEALATECAAEQGKFWEYTDLIYQETTSNDGLDLAKLPDYARQVGLDVNKFNTCLSTEKYAAAVREDEQDAQRAGGRGTPYSVVLGPDGQTVPINGAYPYADVKAIVDSLL